MAKLTVWKQITPDALGSTNVPTWFINFLGSWNLFGQSVYNSLNHLLSGKDNLVWTKYPATGYATLTTASTYTTLNTFTPIKFSWPYPQVYAPNNVRIGSISPQNGAVMTTAPSITGAWSYDSSTAKITVNYITGLADNTTYYLTFIAD